MKRLPLFLLLLAFAFPVAATTPERWFVAIYAGTTPSPQFDGPHLTLAGCEAELRRVMQSNREFVERARQSEGRETIYVMRLRRDLQAMELSTLCERR